MIFCQVWGKAHTDLLIHTQQTLTRTKKLSQELKKLRRLFCSAIATPLHTDGFVSIPILALTLRAAIGSSLACSTPLDGLHSPTTCPAPVHAGHIVVMQRRPGFKCLHLLPDRSCTVNTATIRCVERESNLFIWGETHRDDTVLAGFVAVFRCAGGTDEASTNVNGVRLRVPWINFRTAPSEEHPGRPGILCTLRQDQHPLSL